MKAEMKKTANRTLLIVDDEADIRELLYEQFGQLGIHCITAIDGQDAIEKIETLKPDAVLSDIKMPNVDGIEMLKLLRERGNQIPVVYLTGHGNLETMVSAIKVGAADFHRKPYDKKALIDSVSDALLLGAKMNAMETDYDKAFNDSSAKQQALSQEMKTEFLRMHLERAIYFRK